MKVSYTIKPGDKVTTNGTYHSISNYFAHGPLEVIRIRPAPDYAGGYAVICDSSGVEVGFYINGVKKVK